MSWLACLLLTLHGVDLTPLENPAPVDGVRFDSRITCRYPVLHDYTTLFTDNVCGKANAGVIIEWIEPHFSAGTFPFYPVGESFVAAGETVRYQSSKGKIEQPTESDNRDYTQYLAGAYPPTDVLDVFGEELDYNVHFDDIELFSAVLEQLGCTPVLPFPDRDGVGFWKLCEKEDLLQSIEFYDRDQNLLKRMEYQYSTDETRKRLSALHVSLEERAVTIPLEFSVTANGKPGVVKGIKGAVHAGGRDIAVEYVYPEIDAVTLTLPGHIRVQHAQTGEYLREAEQSNYRYEPPAEITRILDTAAAKAGELSSSRYKVILMEGFLKPPEALSEQLLSETEAILQSLQSELPQIDSMGLRLRQWNRLLHCQLILDSRDWSETWKSYAELLATSQDARLVLNSTLEFARLLYRWNRLGEADEAIRIGRNAIDGIFADEDMLLYFQDAARGNLPYILLKGFQPDELAELNAPKVAFEFLGAYFSAVERAEELLRSGSTHTENFGIIPRDRAQGRAYCEEVGKAAAGHLIRLADNIPEAQTSETINRVTKWIDGH